MVDERLIDWSTEYFAGGELDLVRRAYTQAALAHDGQLRESGVPYILHCVEVAHMLAELRLDHHAVAAGLLHDVVEDTDWTVERLQKQFGAEVARLVDGVTKLARIDTMSKMSSRDIEEQEAESLRKMFLAMTDDVRVVLIKLADRLHNMRTLDSLSPDRRERIARETLEIFAPLANRLGIWQMKWELEELGFRYYDPHAYQQIANLLDERREELETYLAKVRAELQTRLRLEGIAAEISGRPKHIYSIYRKMRRKGVEFDQIYDVRGLRVIVDTVQDCYAALGVVHSLWTPLPGEFDDFHCHAQRQYVSIAAHGGRGTGGQDAGGPDPDARDAPPGRAGDCRPLALQGRGQTGRSVREQGHLAPLADGVAFGRRGRQRVRGHPQDGGA